MVEMAWVQGKRVGLVVLVLASLSCAGKSTHEPDGGGAGSSGRGGQGGGGSNLLVNGDFSDGNDNWQFTEAIDAASSVTNGALCLALEAGGYGVLGYPTAGSLSLEGATSYEFAFDAWGGDDVTITAKVGDAELPYDDYTTSTIEPTAEVERYSQRFVQTRDDPTAGVAFIASASAVTSVCFDNVNVRESP